MGRLLQAVPTEKLSEVPTQLMLMSKWGCDGSSGHSQYKQVLSEEYASDSSVFLTAVVPLELKNGGGVFGWKNPRPSSTRLCRPLVFKFEKETAEVIRMDVESTCREIDALKPSTIQIAGREFTISHNLVLTMIDGKVAHVISAPPPWRNVTFARRILQR